MSRISTYTHDGLTFDVRDQGPLDGEVVVLLHGFPERAASWDQVASRLHAQGYRTLAPDQRGYSPGARPRRRRDHTTTHLVGDVVALVEEAGGGPVHLVGHDWGAVVAWSVALARPDLLRTLTAFSVPHPAAYLRSFTRSTQALRSTYILAFQVPGLVEWLGRTGRMKPILRRGGMTPEEVERFQSGIVEHGALRGGLSWYRALPFTDRSRTGGKVRVPTTMVWSDGDAFLVREGAEATAALVDAPYELVVLRGVTHWIPTQAPDAAAEAVLERISGT